MKKIIMSLTLRTYLFRGDIVVRFYRINWSRVDIMVEPRVTLWSRGDKMVELGVTYDHAGHFG